MGAPAWTVDVDGPAVVDESVEYGGGCDVVAEIVAPSVPFDVGGDHS